MKNQKSDRPAAENTRKPTVAPKPAAPKVASRGAQVNAGVTVERPKLAWWHVAIGLLLSIFVAFEVYGPALHGEFLFDDSYLPFLVPGVADAPLRAWLGVRPFLMVTYWWNYQTSGLDPTPYHAVSILLHAINAVLAWAIVRRFLKLVGQSGFVREVLAVFSGLLFLLHPVQTEAVAYVASRSEALSILFFLGALCVFVYRPSPVVGWARSLAILALFGIACTVKEHTVVLPALLLLIDFYFTTPFSLKGATRNWRLYVPIAAIGVLAVAAVIRVLSTALTAGFVIKDFTWYQYLFTQFRVVWLYLRLYVLPVGQSADYDLTASSNLLDQGSIIGLVALLGAAFLAWQNRTKYPLASFGFFGFLLLLAPTSSFVPIRDVAVERRLYLPFICLLLITVDVVRRLKLSRLALVTAVGLVAAVAGYASYQRNHVWSSALALWQDTSAKNPNNARALFQLAFAQWQAGQCAQASNTYAKVAATGKYKDDIPIDWAHALDCAGKQDEAVAKLREAAAQKPTAHLYATMGMVQAKQNKAAEALESLATAEKLNPRFDMLYVYRGNVYLMQGNVAGAEVEFRKAASMNPLNQPAREALARVRQKR